MEIKGIQPGQLVKSKAGRDKDKYFLVYDMPGATSVRVVDGMARKVEKPKPKNMKHLYFFRHIASEIAEKLLSGRKVSNAEVKKSLQSLVEKHGEASGSGG